jgi:hypothetical protein
MGYARKLQISLSETPYYHCVARCVRRAWLRGLDQYAGKDYSHRKEWVIDRLRELSNIFAIDVCAYAVMNASSGREVPERRTHSSRTRRGRKSSSGAARLMNVSWFMRCLNEHLARRANAKDNCTGCEFRSMIA